MDLFLKKYLSNKDHYLKLVQNGGYNIIDRLNEFYDIKKTDHLENIDLEFNIPINDIITKNDINVTNNLLKKLLYYVKFNLDKRIMFRDPDGIDVPYFVNESLIINDIRQFQNFIVNNVISLAKLIKSKSVKYNVKKIICPGDSALKLIQIIKILNIEGINDLKIEFIFFPISGLSQFYNNSSQEYSDIYEKPIKYIKKILEDNNFDFNNKNVLICDFISSGNTFEVLKIIMKNIIPEIEHIEAINVGQFPMSNRNYKFYLYDSEDWKARCIKSKRNFDNIESNMLDKQLFNCNFLILFLTLLTDKSNGDKLIEINDVLKPKFEEIDRIQNNLNFESLADKGILMTNIKYFDPYKGSIVIDNDIYILSKNNPSNFLSKIITYEENEYEYDDFLRGIKAISINTNYLNNSYHKFITDLNYINLVGYDLLYPKIINTLQIINNFYGSIETVAGTFKGITEQIDEYYIIIYRIDKTIKCIPINFIKNIIYHDMNSTEIKLTGIHTNNEVENIDMVLNFFSVFDFEGTIKYFDLETNNSKILQGVFRLENKWVMIDYEYKIPLPVVSEINSDIKPFRPLVISDSSSEEEYY